MSKSTSVEFSEQYSINPALKTALASLDLQLEDELARYRRQQGQQKNKSYTPLNLQQMSKSQSLVEEGGEYDDLLLTSSVNSVEQLLEKENILVNQQDLAEQTKQLDDSNLGNDSRENSTLDSKNLSSSQKTVASLVHQPNQEKVEEDLDLIKLAAKQTPPEDYLESSERLLRTLDEEKKEEKKRGGKFIGNLFTPLGIGSMLLFFVASFLLGSALLSPESFSHLGLDKLFNSKDNNQEGNSQKTASDQVNQSDELVINNGPNLAKEEFVNLDLETLSTLEIRTSKPVTSNPSNSNNSNSVPNSVTSTTTPNRVIAPRSNSDLATALLPPYLRPQSIPPYGTPPSVAPVPNSAISSQTTGSQTTNNSVAAINTNQYYVLVNFTSDRSLEQVKMRVNDAFVRDFPQGKRIQMGSFPKPEDAKVFADQLKQEGIEAYVYHHGQ